jgi:uncharacterized phage infection (PIP) family protein YhgE
LLNLAVYYYQADLILEERKREGHFAFDDKPSLKFLGRLILLLHPDKYQTKAPPVLAAAERHFNEFQEKLTQTTDEEEFQRLERWMSNAVQAAEKEILKLREETSAAIKQCRNELKAELSELCQSQCQVYQELNQHLAEQAALNQSQIAEQAALNQDLLGQMAEIKKVMQKLTEGSEAMSSDIPAQGLNHSSPASSTSSHVFLEEKAEANPALAQPPSNTAVSEAPTKTSLFHIDI